MKRGITTREGDVFVVPTSDGRGAVGQVVGTYKKHSLYLAVHDRIASFEDARMEAQESLAAPILFLAQSLDALIYHGDWPIIGNAPISPDTPFPAYKVMFTDHVGQVRVDVMDYSGERRRPATPDEAVLLPNRSTVAPIRLQRALDAWLGNAAWLDAYDRLRPGGRATTAEMFP